jgi:hypothetical protein
MIIDAATAAFKDSAFPYIGILNDAFASFSVSIFIPLLSLPIIKAAFWEQCSSFKYFLLFNEAAKIVFFFFSSK